MIYDSVDIEFNGFKLSARPILFNYDKNGNPISIIKYETLCPNCGNLIEIFDLSVIKCTCKVNQQKIVKVGSVKSDVKKEIETCPFVDPIELGIFKI